MKALFLDTLRELTARKIIVLYAVLTVVLLLGVWVTWEVRQNISPQAEFSENGELGLILQPWVVIAFSKITSIFIFFAVLSSAGLMPRLMERGRVEFYLSKPQSRSKLLLIKLLSVWLIYGAAAFIGVLIVYGVTGAVHGFLDGRILILFAVYAVDFLVWVSLVVFAGVISASTSWAIMAAFGLWLAQWLLSMRDFVAQITDSKLLVYAMQTLYYISPKTDELGDLAVALVVRQPVETWLPLWSALLFSGVVTGAALWVFRNRDF